jgi:hypothetical protein
MLQHSCIFSRMLCGQYILRGNVVIVLRMIVAGVVKLLRRVEAWALVFGNVLTETCRRSETMLLLCGLSLHYDTLSLCRCGRSFSDRLPSVVGVRSIVLRHKFKFFEIYCALAATSRRHYLVR